MNPTRRSVLAAGLSTVLFATVSRADDSTLTPRIRHNAASPDGKKMLEKYARAVKRMMAPSEIPESDPRSWTYQWYIHAVPQFEDGSQASKSRELDRVFGATSSPGKTLAQALWTTCQAHVPQSDANMFLPWHRMYLLAFEEIVRSVLGDNDFTLPYWDYTSPGQRALPSQFRNKTDGTYGSLYRENRKKVPGLDINAGDPMDKGTTMSPYNLSALTIPQYSGAGGFCVTLDQGLHGAVHVGVGNGTNMGSVPTAAGDPIFWLHHCNIDRLWAAWNDHGGKNPATSRRFAFADRNGARIEMDARDMGDTQKLGYRYDNLPPKMTPVQLTTSTGATEEKLIASSDDAPKPLGAAPTRIPLRAAAPSGEIGAAVAGISDEQRLVVVVSGIRCDVQPGTLYEVFLDLPPNANDAAKRAHYVGTFSFFDAGERQNSVQFDATSTLRRLREQNRLAADTSVTIDPVHAPVENARAVVGRILVLQQ